MICNNLSYLFELCSTNRKVSRNLANQISSQFLWIYPWWIYKTGIFTNVCSCFFMVNCKYTYKHPMDPENGSSSSSQKKKNQKNTCQPVPLCYCFDPDLQQLLWSSWLTLRELQAPHPAKTFGSFATPRKCPKVWKKKWEKTIPASRIQTMFWVCRNCGCKNVAWLITVDGRNRAPLGMYNNGINTDIFTPATLCFFYSHWRYVFGAETAHLVHNLDHHSPRTREMDDIVYMQLENSNGP